MSACKTQNKILEIESLARWLVYDEYTNINFIYQQKVVRKTII